jgi:quinolinate synthase
MDDISAVLSLKKARNALILAHLYQRPEVQEIADVVGDSLDLSRKAHGANADVIVLCGVRFMAETAKILNPEKTVLLPEPGAGCPMADMVTPEDVARLRAGHPHAAVVCYINSSAEIKAESDVCCTSSNAVRVVASLPGDEVIFVPDKNLGQYVARQLPQKRVVLHDGFCPTHHRVTPEDVDAARKARPGAPILAHPECVPGVLEKADYVGSTLQIIQYAQNSSEQEFIVGTEMGVIHRMQTLCPEKRFYSLHAAMVCPNMKRTTLQSVRGALEDTRYQIELDGQIAQKASVCLERMLSV